MKILTALFVALIATGACWPQTSSSQTSAPAENASDLTYHFTVMLPQYRFLDTSGNPGRVGEYDSLQQSVGGDLQFNYVDPPAHLNLKSTASFVSRDDYDLQSRLTVGKWFDFRLENRSFIRHLDNNFSDGSGHNGFYADLISPDIIRTDSIAANAVFGLRRRMNNAQA